MTNARARIAQAAGELLEAGGASVLTFDAVARRAGVSRSGIVYHFASKDALTAAAHAHLAQRWDADIADRLAGDRDNAKPEDLLAAFVQQHMRRAPTSIPEVIARLLGDEGARPAWADAEDRWNPAPAADDDEQVRRFAAGLAARGLWLYQHSRDSGLSDDQLDSLVGVIVRLGTTDR